MPGEEMYHHDERRLQAGDVISPRWWAIIVSQGGARYIDSHVDGHIQYYREAFIEYVRRHRYPHRASRLRATFAWDDSVTPVRDRFMEPVHTLYRVHAQATLLDRVDAFWLSLARRQPTYEAIEWCVDSYWKGLPSTHPQWEWVVEGDLVVLGVA